MADFLNISTNDTIQEELIKAAGFGLVEFANKEKLNGEQLALSVASIMEQMIQDKVLVIQDFNAKTFMLTNKLSQSVTRHNQQVLWVAARSHFKTDAETISFLQHVGINKHGAYFKGKKSKKVTVTQYLTYDFAQSRLLKFSVKKMYGLQVEMSFRDFNLPSLLDEYAKWKRIVTGVVLQNNFTTK